MIKFCSNEVQINQIQNKLSESKSKQINVGFSKTERGMIVPRNLEFKELKMTDLGVYIDQPLNQIDNENMLIFRKTNKNKTSFANYK